MKKIIFRALMLLSMAIMVAFTVVPAPHQIPDNNRVAPAVVYQKPPATALTLSTPNLTVVQNNEVCVEVTATGFDQILTMQYSMNWDPHVLKFKDLRRFGLSSLDTRNFGQHLLDKGVLTFSWYDQKLVGMTHEDGFVLYEMCFDAIGKPGSETTIEFTSKPTVVEISNAAGVFLDLRTETGKVNIE